MAPKVAAEMKNTRVIEAPVYTRKIDANDNPSRPV
jgi:hypothetical protein